MFLTPKPPPTSGAMTRIWRSSMPRIRASPAGSCAGPGSRCRPRAGRPVVPDRRARPRPSIGMPTGRFMRYSRFTTTAASLCAPPRRRRNRSTSRRRDCRPIPRGRSGAPGPGRQHVGDRRQFVIADLDLLDESSASSRVGATHMAMGWPTNRTLPPARPGSTEGLKPAMSGTARIGRTSGKSAAMKTRSRMLAGISIAFSRACAMELRRMATSWLRGKRRSATNWPRPRRWRHPPYAAGARRFRDRMS